MMIDPVFLDRLPFHEAVQLVIDWAAGLSDCNFCLLLNSLSVGESLREGRVSNTGISPGSVA